MQIKCLFLELQWALQLKEFEQAAETLKLIEEKKY